MVLFGNAVIVIWNDINPESRQDFLNWHNQEHIPERMSVAGFLRGRRAHAICGKPEFLTFYEIESEEFFRGEYARRLEVPTSWTKSILPKFYNTHRSLCKVIFRAGNRAGPIIGSIRMPEKWKTFPYLTSLIHTLSEGILGNNPSILGINFIVADDAANRAATKEHALRREPLGLPGGALLVEGAQETSVSEAIEQLLALLIREGGTDINSENIAIYREEFCLPTISPLSSDTKANINTI